MLGVLIPNPTQMCAVHGEACSLPGGSQAVQSALACMRSFGIYCGQLLQAEWVDFKAVYITALFARRICDRTYTIVQGQCK